MANKNFKHKQLQDRNWVIQGHSSQITQTSGYNAKRNILYKLVHSITLVYSLNESP